MELKAILWTFSAALTCQTLVWDCSVWHETLQQIFVELFLDAKHGFYCLTVYCFCVLVTPNCPWGRIAKYTKELGLLSIAQCCWTYIFHHVCACVHACMCVCVCVHVCMFVCVHVCVTHMHMHTFKHTQEGQKTNLFSQQSYIEKCCIILKINSSYCQLLIS